jgi:hypothetical protein
MQLAHFAQSNQSIRIGYGRTFGEVPVTRMYTRYTPENIAGRFFWHGRVGGG